MSVTLHAVLAIAICAGVTIALRALPFVCFGEKNGLPPLIASLGAKLPAAIMAALVVYCLKSVPFGSLRGALEQLIAGAFVVAVHLFKRNTLLSIAAGTALYMLLIRL